MIEKKGKRVIMIGENNHTRLMRLLISFQLNAFEFQILKTLENSYRQYISSVHHRSLPMMHLDIVVQFLRQM